jgi:ABC-type transport system involved in multi-copper enzyme maturation permease subunit
MLNVSLIKNSIDKEIRSKSVIFLFVFTLAFIYLGHMIASSVKEFVNESNLTMLISNSSQAVIVSFVSLCANLIAMIVASSVLRSDISSRIMPQILTMPISRAGYLFNRIVGAWLLVMLLYTISLVFGISILYFADSIKVEPLMLMGSYLFMALELLGLIFMSSFVSMYGNKIGTLVVTIVYYFSTRVAQYRFAQEGFNFSDLTVGKIYSGVIYYLTPRLGELAHISENYLSGKGFEFNQIAYALIHFLAIMIVWSVLYKILFDRKEF